MTTLFRTVLSCEVLAVFVMAAVSLARLVLKKAPKRLTIFLWLIVCLRLLVPVRLEAPGLARAGTGKRFVERGRTHFRDRRAFQPVVVDGAPQRFKRHRAGLYRAAVGQPRVRSSAVSLGHRRGGAFSGAASEALSPAKKASGRSGNFARCVCLR